jgi:Schlafen, AlbA_2
MAMLIDDIPVRHIRTLMSSALYRKLKRLRIDTIHEIRLLSRDSFKKSKSSGYAPWKHVKSLLTIINDDPDRIVATYLNNKERNLPFRLNQGTKTNISSLFFEAVKDFFTVVENDFAKDCIFKRYGLDGRSYTLEEIGVYHGRTRERVRQIILLYKNKLAALAKGETVTDVNCILDATLRQELVRFRKYLKSKQIQDFAILSREFFGGIEGGRKVKLHSADVLLLELLGYDLVRYRNSAIVFPTDAISKDQLEKIIRIVVEELRNVVLPETVFYISVLVKRNLNDGGIPNSLIRRVCEVLPDIESIRSSGERKYQVRFDLLKSQGDRAYRILEGAHQAMHFVDIQRIIKAKLIERSERKLPRTLALNAFSSDDRFVPQGRSGYWALREWGETGKTVKELMKEALITANRPCSLKEITDFVRAKRTIAKKSTISSFLHLYKNVFTRLVDNKYILSEWRRNYGGEIADKTAIRTFPKILFSEYNAFIVDLFQKAETKELRKQFLVEQLRVRFGISDPGARDRIGGTEYLVTRKEGTRCYLSLAPRYVEIIRSQTDRSNNSEVITDKLRELLEESPALVLPLRSVVKTLSLKYGFKAGTVYRVVSKSQIFYKSIRRGSTMIRLSKDNTGLKPEDRGRKVQEIESILATGENKYVEFKSSLRWDSRTSSLNKELEIEIARAVCGFANSDGGRLFVGVDDSGSVVGLENDYHTLGKKNRDGFQLHVNNVLSTCLGKDIYSSLTVRFFSIGNKDICEIKVSQSKPVFLNNRGQFEFYVRAPGSTLKLNAKEQYDYIGEHWK